jgi:hypothetical protein
VICGWSNGGSAFKTVPSRTNSLQIANGWITDYGTNKFFIGGNRPEDLYVISNPSATYKVSFIHNFDPLGNVLLTKPAISGSTNIGF